MIKASVLLNGQVCLISKPEKSPNLKLQHRSLLQFKSWRTNNKSCKIVEYNMYQSRENAENEMHYKETARW
jgi:hypothetical protein